ncbi:serine/threonine protein phosphatase [hydrothermal vent metagenome]|uniref:Serine/threonine protein phosphatase n=1 Tax=hydrothermal vent metagenome TaxID=652676 RepID=A0A1W1BMQ0_9ZZZZ
MQNHYIIGDVHGEYQTLLALVAKLPKDAKLVFVGDLIDRGLESKKVIAFIKKYNHLTLMGNHEVLFIWYARELIRYFKGEITYEELNPKWGNSGRLHTFLSYGMVKVLPSGISDFVKDEANIEALLEDIAWMKKLPLYLELDAKHSSGKKVVVSHSNISQVWNIRHDKKQKALFEQTTLWTREKETYSKADIFNIYGHTPKEYAVEIAEDYACIDRGCCFYGEKGYGKLSAYCVESGEVIEVAHV